MIRQARFTDIPRIVELIAEMHARSRYAALTAFDAKATRSIVQQSLQRDGGSCAGATRAQVAAGDDGIVQGFIITMLTPIYDVCTDLLATDWLFYASDRASAKDAALMVDDAINWAEANPRVKVLRFGVTDAIGDPARAGKLYERRGFRMAGAIWERDTTRMEAAA